MERFSIGRVPLCGPSIMIFSKVKIKQKTTYVLNSWRHQEGTLEWSRSTQVSLFWVLLKFPAPCGHMKGLSIWEILLPNHKYFIYPGRDVRGIWAAFWGKPCQNPVCINLAQSSKVLLFGFKHSVLWEDSHQVCGTDRAICQYPGLNLENKQSNKPDEVTSSCSSLSPASECPWVVRSRVSLSLTGMASCHVGLFTGMFFIPMNKKTGLCSFFLKNISLFFEIVI